MRLRRSRFARGGRFVFRPWLGGRLELSGVFGGSQSFASSTATRSNSARISASFSSEVRRERSGRGMERLTHIPTLNARLLGGCCLLRLRAPPGRGRALPTRRALEGCSTFFGYAPCLPQSRPISAPG